MPVVKKKGIRFVVKWTEEQDDLLLSLDANPRYRKLCRPHKQGYRKIIYLVNWKLAEREGALKGLPDISVRKLSQRLSYLKANIADPTRKRKKSKKQAKNYKKKDKKYHVPSMSKKYEIWKAIPDEIKQKYGHKPKRIWTPKQQKILLKLGKEYANTCVDWHEVIKDSRINKLPLKYRKIKSLCNLYSFSKYYSTDLPLTSNQEKIFLSLIKRHRTSKVIDWKTLMEDPRVKELPKKYHKDLSRLRKYYWSIARDDFGTEEYKRKKREASLDYKHRTIERYRINQEKRAALIRDAVNDQLRNNLKLRK